MNRIRLLIISQFKICIITKLLNHTSYIYCNNLCTFQVTYCYRTFVCNVMFVQLCATRLKHQDLALNPKN